MIRTGNIVIGPDGGGVYGWKKISIYAARQSLTYTLTCPVYNCPETTSSPLDVTYEVSPVLDMTQWNSWGSCTPCPASKRQRYRPCVAEYPQFGLTCITGQTPEETACSCDCGTPTDDGSGKNASVTILTNTEIGSRIHYTCNNGKKWENAASSLVFRCSDGLVWAALDSETIVAYGPGCIDCGSPPVLSDIVYSPFVNQTTIDTEVVFNCNNSKVLLDGSSTATMKCIWDEDDNSYKWIANTGTMNISVSSDNDWKMQLNEQGI